MSAVLDAAIDEMVDLVFPVRGETIATDHALPLARGIAALLPWWADEPEVGILPIWGLSRCDGQCYVGGRARLTLRVPRRRLAGAEFPPQTVLDAGGILHLGRPTVRELVAMPVVHSHFVDVGTADESLFLAHCRGLLEARGMIAELVCGRPRQLQGARGMVRGYSLMVSGLRPELALELQHQGLGFNRELGCGVFVPHKNTAAVSGD
jgi:CRISPR-associated protein Cas6